MRRQIFLVGLLVAMPHVAGAQGSDAAPIRPFTIHVPDGVLVDLKARLANARIPDALQGEGWTHGTDVRYLKELVAYWRDRFDWREQERSLNRLEQFTTTIDGLTITLYWVTQTAASSARVYYESRHAAPATSARRVEVPTACADFPKEVIWSPRRWLEARYHITRRDLRF